MGKPTGKKKLEPVVEKLTKPNKAERSSKHVDEDTAVFIQMSQELKEEGNRLFQKRDNEGAMLKYEKALKLLPGNHIDVASLRSNMAGCYMQMGIGEYPRAIHECNLALEVAPKYSKALLKRARCYEALGKLEWAWRDVRSVLSMEPGNVTALEIEESVKKAIEGKGLKVEEIEAALPPDEPSPLKAVKAVKEKTKKRKNNRVEKKGVEKVNLSRVETEQVKEKKVEESKDVKVDKVKDNKVKRVKDKRVGKKTEDKVVVEDKNSIKEETVATRPVKLVINDDIRLAQLPVDCSIGLVREVVWDRFPGLEGVLIKYKDQEGDLITITTTAELRMAESASHPQGSLRLYLVEVSPDKEPSYEGFTSDGFPKANSLISSVSENGNVGKVREEEKVTTCVEDWIVQFARLFKEHVGFESDSYLDLHDLGLELYSEAIEETVTTENAQKLFDIAGGKFQEMAALGLFNLGNVHMNKARKWVVFAEDGTKESIEEQVKKGREWAEKEYVKAGLQYEEALKIKPDFYEGFLALGQQQFELAKLSWCYAVGTKNNLDSDLSAQVLDLYNKAEDSMEHGMQIWEELEEQRLNGLSLYDKYRDDLVNLGLEGYLKDVPADEAAEQAAHLKSQMYILWGTLLYERSVVEFKMGLSAWEESLAASVEKFELAGVSPTDLAVIVKNHCSNGTSSEGLGFKIDEIVQAWNDMYDVKRWQTGVPSFRLEPLFRRRVSKLQTFMEHL
ncbi:putative PB1 domain, tetratricopeptide-like helical domain superfamily [Helianthus annuus]|uniref:43kDa postsynaptic protein n=1 Tax=Helianthus annuus TaxID=4232 RepID=A0A251RYG9_HELAN|nr:protein PHOX1 [Helianthus annuus]XP_035841713.1 protein PHOX1 [Helianthus annuus]KAF5759828.1 putative 43kDa postsynaptic protein [Helianthus annuus]KAJ0442554.1 putative PB1 domain, tetratricopeptide-like helical domain superfamily [Helianthus annuus]KAJ0460288.1 putative PB1 domain, tetratricopeptide-like helical domain superfamily, protein PHOX1-4 [Helianthus annuus]KAJ0638909.1 putative PB1 domain, tetratricopeptide-like helical domain superfamily, protein PHOX1-4 [Helianthus annuus]KA